MSANRSVLAAQRRRAGPTNSEPAIPGRGPQPSINSSQMFANQGKQMPGVKQQQSSQQQQQQTKEGLSSVSKMTIPQAITLITLRLGSVESKIMNLQESGSLGLGNNMQMEGQENMVLIDKNVIQSITSRLESLEKRSSASSGSVSGSEVNLLKQQVETVKQAVIKSNSVTANLAKDNKDLKTQVEYLKNELIETKELLHTLQNLTMDNSQKLMALSMGIETDLTSEFEPELNGEMLENVRELDYDNLVKSSDFTQIDGFNDTLDKCDIVTGNLKTIIENEINETI